MFWNEAALLPPIPLLMSAVPFLSGFASNVKLGVPIIQEEPDKTAGKHFVGKRNIFGPNP